MFGTGFDEQHRHPGSRPNRESGTSVRRLFESRVDDDSAATMQMGFRLLPLAYRMSDDRLGAVYSRAINSPAVKGFRSIGDSLANSIGGHALRNQCGIAAFARRWICPYRIVRKQLQEPVDRAQHRKIPE